jgi:DNA-binding CsgD family transcriptional regulator
MQANELLSLAYKHARLTPKQEWIMGLYMDGLRQREIAIEVGCSQQMVSKAIKICIKKLRKNRDLIRKSNIIATTICGC